MPCYRPLDVPRRGFIDLRQSVACGQCIGCRLERSAQWATRCVHEASLHQVNSFVTLTYNDQHLPLDGSVNKRHVQLFLKRLRKIHAPAALRYFACGEYGDQLQRPHYHALLFGIDFADKRQHSLGKSGPLFVSDLLDETWRMGHCFIGSVTSRSAGYVARYCLKKVNGPLADAHYQGRSPEFLLMSRRPGLGSGWFERFKSDCYPSDFAVIDGRRRSVPRYYDKLLDRSEPEKLEIVKEARLRAANRFKSELTPDRLAVREEVTSARTGTLLRTLE